MEPSTSSYGVIPEKNLKIWGTFQDVGAGGEKILKTAKLAHVANYDHGFVVTMTDETYCFTRAGAGGYRISKIRELSGIRVKVTGSLTGVKVRQVALPGWYKRCTVALSVGGEVHHWGSACGSSNHPWRPTSIPREHFDYQDVTSITCSAHMCVALTSKGELYQWKFGDMMPQKVFIDGSVPLKKITGTSDFIVALTVKGELHYVEIKAFSRLLANTRTSAWRAIFKDYKIEDIASCGAEHVVVVELKDSTRFAFSYCQEDYPERPFIPSFTLPSDASMDELFAKCGDTCNRTISAQIEPPPRRRVSDDICDLWENKKHADVAFSVGGKSSRHTCRFLLAGRSEYFEIMFSKEWNEAKGGYSAIEVKDTKHDIFEALLFFIYSDQIKFEEDEYENIFELMKLADFYCDVNIRQECEKMLMSNINAENAFFLAKNASSANALTLEGKVIKFIVDNILILDTSSSQEMIDSVGIDAFQKIWVALLQQ